MDRANRDAKCLFLGILLCSASGATGCAEPDDHYVPAIAVEASESSDVTTRQFQVEPIATASLPNGSELRFFAWEDGSAGVLEVGEPGRMTVTADSRFEGLNVAELFWAVTPEGTPVPDGLLEHHDALVQDGDAEAEFGGRQGWLAASFPEPEARTTDFAPCNNGTFYLDHCGNAATYPDGPSCHYDSGGSLSWRTGTTRRYHAAFCLDQGTAGSYLYYDNYNSDCTTQRIAAYIWGAPWNGGTYNANVYFHWTWHGPSGAKPRQWFHAAWNISSARFDWATKFKNNNSCSPL